MFLFYPADVLVLKDLFKNASRKRGGMNEFALKKFAAVKKNIYFKY